MTNQRKDDVKNTPNTSMDYLESQGYKEGCRLFVITVGEVGVLIDDKPEYKLRFSLPKSLRRDNDPIDEWELMLSVDDIYVSRKALFTSELNDMMYFKSEWDRMRLFDPISNSHSAQIIAHEGNIEQALEYVKKAYHYFAMQYITAYTQRAQEYLDAIAAVHETQVENAKRCAPMAKKRHAEFWQREFNDGLARVSFFSVDENDDSGYDPKDARDFRMMTFKFESRSSLKDEWNAIKGGTQLTTIGSNISDELASDCVAYLIQQATTVGVDESNAAFYASLATFKTSDVPSFY